MSSRKYFLIVSTSLLMLILLANCNVQAVTPNAGETSAPIYTALAQTLQAVGTALAQASATPLPPITQTPITQTPIPQTATSVIPTATSSLVPTTAPTRTAYRPPCDAATFIMDVSYPDGSVFTPSTSFIKTWRLRNAGTCTWTTAYALVFLSGSQMGGISPTGLTGNVAPGQSVDITVNLTAPSAPGHYRGYWMLRNQFGVKFGAGYGAADTFWVDINVVQTGLAVSTTTITSHTPDPSGIGQTVAVSANVSGSGPTPTGTVAVTISGMSNTCTITLAAGSGSCSVVFTTSGPHALTATYSGDTSYRSSYAAVNHNVKNSSTTSITADTPDPSLPGQSVAVGVTVSGSGVTPTGTVSITGSDNNCTITLSGGGGSCNVIFNSAGTKSLTATYSGDANFSDSTITVGHTVSKGVTLTSINTDNPDPSSVGQAVAVNLVVIGLGVTPTGTVAITGADTNCTVTLSGGGGTCNVVFNSAGSKTLTATYGGDANYNGSSNTASHTVVNNSPSTTTITSDTPDPSAPGQTVTVSVTVSGGGATPTGTVVISGADTGCTLTLSAGSGNCNVIFNTLGSRTLTATYSGDANYNTSAGTASHTAAKGSTTTVISADTPDPSTPGQTVAVSVTVNGAGTMPTGTVSITGADTNCTITLSGGTGTCNVVFNTAGSKTLTATYSGDANYNGSSGTASHTAGNNVTTTTITADTPDPSSPSQTVAVSVTVSGTGSTPTGTVSITGADTNCTLTLSGGSGTCNVVFTTIGAKTLTATYGGDSNYTGSTGSASHTVANNTTTTTITADTPDPSNLGQAVAVSVTVSGSGPAPTGTVAITGADTNCTITLSSGSGTCTAVFNSAGSKTLTATYSGDSNYTGSSGTATHTVNKITSTTAFTTVAPDPSTPGQAVAVIVTVSGAGPLPTGTVAITGADTNCTITLASGNGSCAVIFSSAGSKTLTATYGGDANYNSSSNTASHTVNKIASITAITAHTPDPSTPGQAVAVSVTVSGPGVTPTGSVAITGANTNCTITLSGGTGSCNAFFSSSGAKTLTATFSGDANYLGSSNTASHTVNKIPTTTIINTESPDPSIPGQAVAVIVTVGGTAVTPTGTVAISGADVNCTVTLAGGTGSCAVIFSSAGAKTITAAYSGDTNYATSSTTASHTVNKGASLTVITSDTPDPSTPGQPVSVSVAVSGTGATPSGTVSITGADTTCTVTLSLGSGSCSVVFNTTGSKTLTADYSGDLVYLESSTTASHTVNRGTATTTITSDNPDPSTPGQAVTVIVTVGGAGVTPTGTVSITGATSDCTITLSNGTGNCLVNINTIGVRTLTATYNGDANYNAGSTDTESHTVNQGPTITAFTADNPDPSSTSQTVSVSVSVSGAGVTPTGTVSITSPGVSCMVTLAGGSGSCDVSFATEGAKTLTATYSGDVNYLVSSSTEGHTVKSTTTTTVAFITPNPSTVGQAVLVGVSVSGGSSTPTGTVSITGADVNCTITLTSGAGNCSTVVFNTAGSRTVTATYNGDATHFTSVGTGGQTVNKATATTAINTANPNPSTVGQTVNVVVSVTGPGVPPGGTVSITGAEVNCTVTLTAGSGSCNATFNTAGAKTLVATYNGDANYNAGSTGSLGHTVNLGVANIIVSDIPDPSLAGSSITVGVQLIGAGVVPTGTITVSGADSAPCTFTLSSGNGSCFPVTFTTAGSKTLTITYSGDANYTPLVITRPHTVN